MLSKNIDYGDYFSAVDRLLANIILMVYLNAF